MHRSGLFTLFALAAAAGLAACSDVSGPSTISAPSAAFSKSGTAPSGGSGGGHNGGGSSTGTVSGPPVAPSYTARIDSIGVVPTAVYYGTPSEWTIGGYIFEAGFVTHLKALEGPLVVGACVSVTFSENAGVYNASEIKSELQSKCGG